MICVLNPMTSEVKRVPDTEAHRLVSYGWRYVPKKEFKAWQVRQMEAKRGFVLSSTTVTIPQADFDRMKQVAKRNERRF